MKKLLLCGSLITLCGCGALTQPNSNYVKTGLFQDRFDGMYYHYAETGKSVAINDNNSINTYVGVQEGSGAELINNQTTKVYWEVNYQLTF
ncbi:hypothetical protein HDR61_00410 [bacterium]|nr:hypothetical protein [bacterium]